MIKIEGVSGGPVAQLGEQMRCKRELNLLELAGAPQTDKKRQLVTKPASLFFPFCSLCLRN
jgi:hypothetical protein